MLKKDINVIVLAAGKGTRLNAVDKPKAMYPINNKPMVSYFVDLLEQIKPKRKIFVVGFHGQQIIDYLQNRGEYEFVWQRELLGTGHAVAQVKPLLGGKDGTTVVINVDNPFFKPSTIQAMVSQLADSDAVMAIATVELDPAFAYGRVITNEENNVEAIVEVKNASQEELKITTMNAGLYVFNNNWLWENIDKIKIGEVSGEYYLTDLVEIAVSQNKKVISVAVSHQKEAIGINTLANLEYAEKALE